MNNVLITGGTGFFGRGFVRRLLADPFPQRICIYSRDEWKQAQMRKAFGDDERLRWFVGDVRDLQRLRRAMEGCDTVIHAAALKRVEVGEYNPDEMVKTNVGGAMNVIDAAGSAGVVKVVALSSDKACAPLNCYGASKLLSEKLFLGANAARGFKGTIFAVTRYGNVAGSTGSVIPVWREMLKRGAKELPITHPGATRFWMTLEEAVELVRWTAENMQGGEVVVPELPSYRLIELLAAMGAAARITGMGPGEKLHEEMISGYEAPEFGWCDPYWMKGPGIPNDAVPPNDRVGGKRLSVDDLRKLLEELPHE